MRQPSLRRAALTPRTIEESPCGNIFCMGLSNEDEAITYRELRAIVVDAIRYVTAGQPIEVAADEALQRLRDAGLPMPPNGP